MKGRAVAEDLPPVTFGIKVTKDLGHVHFNVFAGRTPDARGCAGSLVMRHDEFDAFLRRLKPETPLQFACLCDPSDVFEPPDPKPRVVAGCPSHKARGAYQRFVDKQRREVRDGG